MHAVTKILREFISLFVDDGSLAAVVLVWIAICGLVLANRRRPRRGGVQPIYRIGTHPVGERPALRQATYRNLRRTGRRPVLNTVAQPRLRRQLSEQQSVVT